MLDPDGFKAAGEVQVLAMPGGELRASTAGNEFWIVSVNSVAFSPEDGTLAIGGDDRTIKLWRWK